MKLPAAIFVAVSFAVCAAPAFASVRKQALRFNDSGSASAAFVRPVAVAQAAVVAADSAPLVPAFVPITKAELIKALTLKLFGAENTQYIIYWQEASQGRDPNKLEDYRVAKAKTDAYQDALDLVDLLP